MATNAYFNNFKNNSNEQDLLHSLATELIEQRGIECMYIPRKYHSIDYVYGEGVSSFETYYNVEFFIESADAFEGDGELLSKFGLELKDKMTLSVNPRKFTLLTNMEKVLEGDLIFLPLNDSLFEITFVSENRTSFYPTGTIPFNKIECELFKYNNEKIDTGIAQIDDMDEVFQPEVNTSTMPTGSGEWNPNREYNKGDKVFPTEDNWTGLYYEVFETYGMKLTNTSEPKWPDYNGAKVVDHEITWIAKGIRNEKDQIQQESLQILDFSDNDPFKFR
jgi:hypothetical protein